MTIIGNLIIFWPSFAQNNLAFLTCPCTFTPEPAMPTPGLGCYSPIGPPDFAHRVSSLPFCNQVSVGNFWGLWLLGLQKPPFLPSAFFPPLFKRKHIDISRVITTSESRAKKKKKILERQTSPTYTAQRDQLMQRKQRLEPLEPGLGLTLTCIDTRLCPTICTNVNFASQAWLLN